jgi:small subunit ribosomal protein S21
MNGVKAYGDNESVEKLLRKFKRLTEATGIITEVKEKMFYEKPSVIKRKKIKDAIRKAKKDRERIEQGDGFDF